MYRHRRKVLWFDTELFLMRGFQYIPSSIGLECLLFPINWFSRAIREKNHRAISIAQLEVDQNFGRLLWLLDGSENTTQSLPFLLDNLIYEAGIRGTHFLSTSIEKNNPVYRTFLDAGFSPTSWERIWLYKQASEVKEDKRLKWRRIHSPDLHSISQLHNRILSRKEKATRPSVFNKKPDYVLFYEDDLSGYAYVSISLNKVFLTPIIDPKKTNCPLLFDSLLKKISRFQKTVYIRQIPNQAWKDMILNGRLVNLFPRHEVMVKHLIVREKGLISQFNQSSSNHHTDTVMPFSRVSKNEDTI